MLAVTDYKVRGGTYTGEINEEGQMHGKGHYFCMENDKKTKVSSGIFYKNGEAGLCKTLKVFLMHSYRQISNISL